MICSNCVYFNVCGDTARTVPCDGRLTKVDKRRQRQEQAIQSLEFLGIYETDVIYKRTGKRGRLVPKIGKRDQELIGELWFYPYKKEGGLSSLHNTIRMGFDEFDHIWEVIELEGANGKA